MSITTFKRKNVELNWFEKIQFYKIQFTGRALSNKLS